MRRQLKDFACAGADLEGDGRGLWALVGSPYSKVHLYDAGVSDLKSHRVRLVYQPSRSPETKTRREASQEHSSP